MKHWIKLEHNAGEFGFDSPTQSTRKVVVGRSSRCGKREVGSRERRNKPYNLGFRSSPKSGEGYVGGITGELVIYSLPMPSVPVTIGGVDWEGGGLAEICVGHCR